MATMVGAELALHAGLPKSDTQSLTQPLDGRPDSVLTAVEVFHARKIGLISLTRSTLTKVKPPVLSSMRS